MTSEFPHQAETTPVLTAEDYATRVRAVVRTKIGHLLTPDVGFLIDGVTQQIARDLFAVDEDRTIIEADEKLWDRIRYELGRVQNFIANALGSTTPEGKPKGTISWDDIATNIKKFSSGDLLLFRGREDFTHPANTESKIIILKEIITRRDIHPSHCTRAYLALISIYKKLQRFDDALKTAEELLEFQQRTNTPEQYIQMTIGKIARMRERMASEELEKGTSTDQPAPGVVEPEPADQPTPEIAENDQDEAPESADQPTPEPTAPEDIDLEVVRSALTDLKQWLLETKQESTSWKSKGAKKSIPNSRKNALLAQLSAKIDHAKEDMLRVMTEHIGFAPQLASLEDGLGQSIFKPGLADELIRNIDKYLV